MSGSDPSPLKPLCLDLIDPALRTMALDDIERGDIGAFLSRSKFGNEFGLHIVAQNVDALKQRGLYEAALVDAYVCSRTNNNNLPVNVLFGLLLQADRARLRAAGDPLPGSGPFTLFRGVAGRGRARRVTGFSWTASFEQAKWFAERSAGWGLEAPAVYRVIATVRDVFFYTNERDEDEFVIAVPTKRPVRVHPATPNART